MVLRTWFCLHRAQRTMKVINEMRAGRLDDKIITIASDKVITIGLGENIFLNAHWSIAPISVRELY